MIKKWAEQQAEKWGLTGDFEVNVEIVTPKKMQALNKKFRQIDKTTDVLSFPIFKTFEKIKKTTGPRHLGDIFINKNDGDKLEFLVKHGIDHLLGFHHE